MTPNYQTYLKAKYNLNNMAINDINWQLIKLAMRKLSLADHTCIHKFLHDCLPIKRASHTTSTNDSTLCLHCQCNTETTWHFFEYQHPFQTAHFLQLQSDITQLHTKHNIDPHMTQLYWQGLQTIQQDASIDDQLQSYPQPLQDLFHAQHKISWDQLYYGCISVTWACQVTISSNYTVNGDIFYATATGLVWKYLLDCWQLCNLALHNPNKIQSEAQVLADQVHLILEMVQANPEIAHLAPPQPAETILQ